MGVLSVGLVAPWRWLDPPTSAFMLREPEVWGAPAWRWTPLRDISPHLAVAVLAAEDQRFPVHRGFDLCAIERALREDRGRPRGASTLTQQVAKNLFLWKERSVLRKAIEAWLTLWIELLWPKRRILEVYLNVAEFEPGVYGAAAASSSVFGLPPDRLTPAQAALLAAALPNPERLKAARPSAYVHTRASAIRRAALGLGGPGFLATLDDRALAERVLGSCRPFDD